MSAVQKFPPAHMIPEEDSQQAPIGQASENNQTDQQPLALPAAPTEEEAQKLDVNANGNPNVVKLDHLGPMVVNTDGTLSRIHNWAQMSEAERERTAKVLGRRNKARLAVLEEQEREGA